MNQNISQCIEQASKVIGKTWPLYSFVTSNPLSGYENSSFKDALLSAGKHLNTNVFPTAKQYQEAWEKGEIAKEILLNLQLENGMKSTPEQYLAQILSEKRIESLNPNHTLDRIMAKWLSAFMDEGLAEWDMPFKSEGFYTAWRNLAVYDQETGSTSLKEIPKTSSETLELILRDFSEKDYTAIFTHHLASLPGWTGYINHRSTSNSDWQNDFPISMQDYLAARLWTAKKINTSIIRLENHTDSFSEISKTKYVWLKAWERTWQNKLIKSLETEKLNANPNTEKPAAQFVFCIDTRSELMRRHVEASSKYETFGYAGFFGIAMNYTDLKTGVTRKSCPPIVDSAFNVVEKPQENRSEALSKLKKKNEQEKFNSYFLTRMKNMLPSAFGFVEITGLFYGFSLVGKTFLPKKINQNRTPEIETICETNIQTSHHEVDKQLEISLFEKVAIVKSAFDIMGWKNFAPLVLFVGHGGHSTNNPFGSSLDCGACAASPGRHNARMLASLANLSDVRKMLKLQHEIEIPDDTVFIGAEHNTTTDYIEIFDALVPESHQIQLQALKNNLSKAQQTATMERLGLKSKSITEAEQKANNWAETRPEWGLAENAGFIIGSREITKNNNLANRCFLQSYEWQHDKNGAALEGIMQGPMVVTQWINSHYYFSTVDNQVYGGGSKITHNITGKFGVVQGNGGDLKMGLPIQSLFKTDEVMHHQPLRLSVFIHAPTERITEILQRNKNLQELVDNEWIYILAIDPTLNNSIFKYEKGLLWKSHAEEKTSITIDQIEKHVLSDNTY